MSLGQSLFPFRVAVNGILVLCANVKCILQVPPHHRTFLVFRYNCVLVAPSGNREEPNTPSGSFLTSPQLPYLGNTDFISSRRPLLRSSVSSSAVAMAHTQLPLETLPLWQSLNNVVFSNTHLAAIPEKGLGLIASDGGNDGSAGALISVPSELVLHVEAVEEYAKQDRNFRQLLDAAGRQSARGDILLFLLVQLAIGLSQPGEELAALPVPWTEYVKFLPDDVPLPTLWTDSERLFLQGTSLEAG